MTHRALVQRNTTSTTDDLGQPSAPAWSTHIASLACWFWQTAEREVVGDKAAIVGDMKMIVPRGTDITEADRINGITSKNGITTIRSGVLLIEAVIPRRDHLELMLRGIS